MGFVSLRTAAFRNLAGAEIDTRGRDVFLVGENGQGKTNFLEALYFCSYASSFRGVRDGEMARNGEKDFAVTAVLDNPLHDSVSISVKDGKKTVFLDGKRVEDRKDLLGAAPCVVFCHEDLEFVSGSPEKRRWFFDQAQSLVNPAYLEDLRNYRRVLKARNLLLRDCRLAGGVLRGETAAVLDALDPQLAAYGAALMEQRGQAAAAFSQVFEPLYREISGIEGVTVRYLPSWKPQEILPALAARRETDASFGVTLTGPHRDRYVFTRKGREFAGKASTGQRRLLALLLRVAQARSFQDRTGKSPVLLLDDVLLELDGEKRRRFLAVMPAYDQAFYTFLPEEPFRNYRKSAALVYRVEGGALRQCATL